MSTRIRFRVHVGMDLSH
uniref:Uncharacterized protein n=1 Tax=Arundo donax TaxID=35708 RepID=A0A0A9G8H5_ARUDO